MNGPNVEILFLSKEDVEKVITYADAVDAVELAYRAQGTPGQLVQPPNAHLWIDAPENSQLILSMPASIKSINVAGMKWTNTYRNQVPGIPAIWGGIVVLNHIETGIPFAIMDATTITHMRTAGGHAAVAAKYLAKKDSNIVAIIGCGAEGRAGLLAFNELFPLKQVRIHDIKPEAMSVFQRDIGSKISAEILIAKNTEEACDKVDIIIMGTWSEKTILFDSMIPEGCFVAALRRFKDVDPLFSKKADKWVLGNRVSDAHFNTPDIGLSYNDVYADMGEIVTGRKEGRVNKKERILYTHMGMGAHDVALGYKIYCKAKQAGLGIKIKLI
jgi:alanine dehydrogenase